MKQLYLLLLLPVFMFSNNSVEKDELKVTNDSIKSVKVEVQEYIDFAWDYIMKGNDSALIFIEKAMEISELKNYVIGKAITFETEGMYYEIVKSNYTLASQLYFKGIEVCEANNLEYASSIYHTLGIMFHQSDSYVKALKYFTIAHNLAKESNDSILIKMCLINLGSVNSSLENFDTAIDFMEESLAFKINIRQDLDYSTYCNLGNLYVKQEKYNKALPYLLKATEQHPDNFNSEINLHFLLQLKALTKDTTGMKPILKRAKVASVSAVRLREKSLLLRTLADYYKSIENYKEAIKYRDEYITAFEEIKEKQRDETVYELETKYETEKKDAQLNLLKVESEKKEQQKQLYFIMAISGLLIASILGFTVKKNIQKNATLAKQKKLLEAALNEKNTLLKEVHHRVKNSFQIVSSLLYLQSENSEDKEAKIAIKEAENRVRSMVLVHQKLYNKDELVGIDTKEYITDLVKDIIDSHHFKEEKIKYELNIVSLVLDIETITPIGLILNELIINCLKHAFKEEKKESKIIVSFTEDNNKLLLTVKDNGKGFEGEIKSSSFGITLMKALSKKLKATLQYNSKVGIGTEATLNIKKFNIL